MRTLILNLLLKHSCKFHEYTAIQKQIDCIATTASSASTDNSQSNSPIDNMVNSALSNMDPIQSEQTGKAIDKIQKGMDLYSDFLGIKIGTDDGVEESSQTPLLHFYY